MEVVQGEGLGLGLDGRRCGGGGVRGGGRSLNLINVVLSAKRY